MASLRGSPRDSCFTSLIVDVPKRPFHRALLIFNYFMTPYLNTRSDKNKISIGSKVPMGIFNL